MMKLLIVDDSAMIRHKIEQSLKHPDIIVAGSAGNGQQALQEFKRLLPDVVTLDLAMPVMGGVECVEHILRVFNAASRGSGIYTEDLHCCDSMARCFGRKGRRADPGTRRRQGPG